MYKRYRVMPYITIILLVTAVMCLLNFQTFVYSLNKDQYKGVQANITNQISILL